MPSRYFDHRDANEAALMAVAAQMGAEFHRTPPFDGVILFRGAKRDVEVKDPAREGHKDEYTNLQRVWIERFKRHGIPLLVWRTVDDVVRDLNRWESL